MLKQGDLTNHHDPPQFQSCVWELVSGAGRPSRRYGISFLILNIYRTVLFLNTSSTVHKCQFPSDFRLMGELRGARIYIFTFSFRLLHSVHAVRTFLLRPFSSSNKSDEGLSSFEGRSGLNSPAPDIEHGPHNKSDTNAKDPCPACSQYNRWWFQAIFVGIHLLSPLSYALIKRDVLSPFDCLVSIWRHSTETPQLSKELSRTGTMLWWSERPQRPSCYSSRPIRLVNFTSPLIW